jgi:hypothetical protein
LAFSLTNFVSSISRASITSDHHLNAQLNTSPLAFPFKQDYYISPGFKKDPFNKSFYVQYFKDTKESSPVIYENLFASSPLLSLNNSNELIITPWIEADEAYCDVFDGDLFLFGLNPPGWYGNLIASGSYLGFRSQAASPFEHLFSLADEG